MSTQMFDPCMKAMWFQMKMCHHLKSKTSSLASCHPINSWAPYLHGHFWVRHFHTHNSIFPFSLMHMQPPNPFFSLFLPLKLLPILSHAHAAHMQPMCNQYTTHMQPTTTTHPPQPHAAHMQHMCSPYTSHMQPIATTRPSHDHHAAHMQLTTPQATCHPLNSSLEVKKN